MRPPPGGLHASRADAVIRSVRAVRDGTGPVEPVDVLCSRGRIAGVGPGLPAPAIEEVDGSGFWLVPGWIDIQVNDMEWIAGGRRPPEEHAERIRRRLGALQAARGVTGFILATLAAPIEDVIEYLRGMKLVLDGAAEPGTLDPGAGRADRAFLGALVEGTFMNPDLCGAHNRGWVMRPEKALIDRLIDTGAVRLMNIAPEVSEDAVDLIRHATSRGVVVGAGHAKPHAERLREAAAAGLRYIIHLGNGPTGSSLKAFHDGGMLEEGLRNDALVASIILDGIHIHPRLARDWIARKEVSRVIAVSDAAFAAGGPGGGFEVLGVRGRVAEGGWLAVEPPPGKTANPLSSDFGALFGSLATERDVFENAVNFLTREMDGVHHRLHPALTLDDALRAASRMTSTNPAALLGLGDRGAIEPGRRADLLFLEVVGRPGAHLVRVHTVWMG